MAITDSHATTLAQAFAAILGAEGNKGDMAFARCLAPDIVDELAQRAAAFNLDGWNVWRVADVNDSSGRTVTADRAVELREAKGRAVLLLVDTTRAGAGMDGIYSAAREIDEKTLFDQAIELARERIKAGRPRSTWVRADKAIKKARGPRRLNNISRWTEFDYLVRLTGEESHPGELLHLLGLWPVRADDAKNFEESLNDSRLFVERLLGTASAGKTPSQRINDLHLHGATKDQKIDLERFLQAAATQPLLPALTSLVDKGSLWVNALQIESRTDDIIAIELVPWRSSIGKLHKWSGLRPGPEADDPPQLVLDPKADANGKSTTLTVRWKCRPTTLAKDTVSYRVTVMTDMDEELAEIEARHGARSEQSCRFSNDHFSELSDDALIGAKVVVAIVGNDQIAPEESEEFIICFGDEIVGQETVGVGRRFRTLSEGVIELGDREIVSALAAGTEALPKGNKETIILRAAQQGKSFQVSYPPLLREIDNQWAEQQGAVGRWRLRVRASGMRLSPPEFIPLEAPNGVGDPAWERLTNAGRKMAERFDRRAAVGQIYDANAKGFDTVKNYLSAWAAVLGDGDPALALANTLEVQTLSGKSIGLMVLPNHPLRVAWHAAYDNLVLHTAFEQGAKPNVIRNEFAGLDGAMFPAFLPGIDGVNAFVFADMLGFFVAGMVPDHDKEPKAAVAVMARALGDSDGDDTAPTIGQRSSQILGGEISKYIDCHQESKLLLVQALRPGDGLTVARALGQVHKRLAVSEAGDESDDRLIKRPPGFVLELYPSQEQRGVAGRFMADVREKRRRGTSGIAAEDQWMLESESLPGGINMPKLRWARKEGEDPKSAAHLAIAFDTFESSVSLEPPDWATRRTKPLYIYGLLSFFDRSFSLKPAPSWRSGVLPPADGDEHPANRGHTKRLIQLQQAVEQCVIRSLSDGDLLPTLRTEISAEKAESLQKLHRQCDWVITLDRNGGVEYFDSPRENKDIYDIYIIDAVPEREDLGSLQLITSTSNLAEVRNLVDTALDQMGLSRSRRNAEYLMNNLKALSGRLAIRLTGQKATTSELIALALSHANCENAPEGDACWKSLNDGFFIPVDDVRDLIPPLSALPVGKLGADEYARPDLIYVSTAPRKGLSFEFVEVKYRRLLRTARSSEILEGIQNQNQQLRKRWEEWYLKDDITPSFKAVRRAKLARVLRFYVDKARRHHLPARPYEAIVGEIDRMIEKGNDYAFAPCDEPDRGWVFCPEYNGATPQEITPPDWSTRIFIFGPSGLPDLSPAQASPTPPRFDESDGGGDEVKGPVADSESAAEEPTDMPSPETRSGATKEASILIGNDALTGSEVRWPITIKGNPHLLIAGLPGMGKTTFLVNLCRQMMEANIRPIVFSYHEDIDEQLEALPFGVRYLDFNGLGFNPLQVADRENRNGYLDRAGDVRDIFTAIYPELGDIQGERIRAAIKSSFIERGWGDPAADTSSLAEPEFRRFLEILRDERGTDKGLKTLLARLTELDDYRLFDLDESAASLWSNDQPVIIRIHKTQNDNLQKAFASLVLYGLYKDMFRRGLQQQITHAIIFDEAHRAARLKLIPTMAKECRKYGISFVLASQEARDFNASVFSAIANYLILRLNETDAKMLVRNISSSDQERMLVDRIKGMQRFKAMYFDESKRGPSRVALLP